jgi:hypothetical protein
LRLVTRDVHRGEGTASINGHALALPWSSSNDGCSAVQEIEIPPTWIGPQMTVSFACGRGPARNGFELYAASVMAE